MRLLRAHSPQASETAGESRTAPVLGEGVDEGVGRGVAALPGAAEQRGGGRVEDESGQVQVLGQLVEVEDGVDLGPEHGVHPLGGERGQGAVVQDSGRVHDGTQRLCRRDRVDQGGELVAVCRVAGPDGDLGAQLGEFAYEVGRAVGLLALSAYDDEVAYAMLADEVTGDGTAERARSTGDEHRAVGVEGGRHREHEFAGVLALAEGAEGPPGLSYVVDGERQRSQDAGLEQFQEFGQHLADGLRSGLDEVERLVGGAGVGLGDEPGVPDVGLAQFQEVASSGQQAQ